MTRIIDLDKIVPDDIEVVLQGDTYLLPGDIPVELMLRVEHATQQLNSVTDSDEGQNVLADLLDAVVDLFRIRQPDVDQVPIGLRQAVMLISQIYSVQEDPAPDPPRPARRAGTTSTSSRAKKTTRAKASGS